MIKALLKKQMLEVFSWLYKDRKTGKKRSLTSLILYSLFYLALFGFLASIFAFLGVMLCEPLLEAKMGWLYWCIMSLIGLFFGVFGSVFNTYATLYQAKDNDLLFSFPLTSSAILITRLVGVYAMGVMYLFIVMIPALIVWLLNAPLTILGTINAFLIPFVLSILVLFFSVIVGWVSSLILTKVKRKNIMTVFLTLLFIGAYYYLYGKAYSLLQAIIVNAQFFGSKVKTYLYPLYHMGLAAEGSALSMLIFTSIVCISFLLLFLVLSRNFLKTATTNTGRSKGKKKKQSISARSVNGALLYKELKRFTSSSTYMLNCGMGIILMPLFVFFIFWKKGDLLPLLSILPSGDIALISMAVMALLVAFDDISAPSISLEGKNLWILKSLPISGSQVLMAKLEMHLLLTLIPAIFPLVAIFLIIKPSLFFSIFLILVPILFVTLNACIGLICNLKMPDFHWTNEVVPIKQSGSVMISLFSGWIIVTLFGVLYYVLRNLIDSRIFVILLSLLLFVADAVFIRYLNNKGARIFENL